MKYFISTFKFAVPLQIVILVLSIPVLDHGETFKIALYTAFGYWVGAWMIVFRRRNKFGLTDQIFIQAGYPLLLVFSFGWAIYGMPLLHLAGWERFITWVWGK